MEEKKLIQILFTPEEEARIKKEAQKYSQPFSTYCRLLILKSLEEATHEITK